MFYNFCIISSLLSTILGYPVNSNPISLSNTVSNKAFAPNLSDPCTLINESRYESFDSDHSLLNTTLLEAKHRIPLAYDRAEDILKTRVLRNLPCTASGFPGDGKIPLAQNLSNNFTVEVLRLFYTSLVNHTAYTFFIFEQMQKYQSNCSSGIILEKAGSLLNRMKAVMCSFRIMVIALLGRTNDSTKDAHKQIFSEELIDIYMCSRQISYICCTLQNALRILTELLSYLRTMGSSQ